MNKLVMAALLATATLIGTHGSASAFQLPGFSLVQPKVSKTAEPEARVHLAQSSDPSVRVQQLEEEIRSLNGRIEEMSFQLLQMQETIRKAQEDNEFRFQDLENGGTKKSGSLERPVDGGNGSDSVAEIITQTPDVGATADSSGLGQPEQQLGSIDLDALAPQSMAYHRRVVHYVEDNETNAEVMRGVLSQRPQIRMDVSATGLDALVAILRAPPSLILLDMHLPDIDGLELLRHLKADALTVNIPVVVVSADALEKETQDALAVGATRYLTKPVSVAELLSVVDALLDDVETQYG